MRRGARIWPAAVALLVALSLEVAPLPQGIDAWRPPWVAMTVIYWAMLQPGRYGVGTAWVIGLVLDVLKGTVLGQHALMLAVTAFLTIRFCQRLRVFPMWHKTIAVCAIVAVYTFLGFWIDGITGDLEGGVLRLAPIVSALLVWPPVYWISKRLLAPLAGR